MSHTLELLWEELPGSLQKDACEGIGTADDVLVEPALRLVDAHGNSALEDGEVVLVIAVHLIHAVTALVEDGEHVVREIVLIVVSGEPDIRVVVSVSEGMLHLAQDQLLHVQTHEAADLFGELTLLVSGAKLLDAGPVNLRNSLDLLDDGKELLHGAEPHAVADLLLVGIAGELGVDDRNAHVDGDLDDLLPVGDRVLTLLLSGARPAVNNDKG